MALQLGPLQQQPLGLEQSLPLRIPHWQCRSQRNRKPVRHRLVFHKQVRSTLVHMGHTLVSGS